MTEGDRSLVMQTRPYAVAHHGKAAGQLIVTALALGSLFALIRYERESALRFLLILPLALVLVRTFVLQHDCGHRSLVKTARGNDRIGTALSFITGVPFEPWRSEHNWHHLHQGQLSSRGVDRMNSPMTLAEAQFEPANAAARVRKISAPNIFVLGTFSLVVQRKWSSGFFQFRPRFRWPFPNRAQFMRGLRVTLAGHVAWMGLMIWTMGPIAWATVLLPACFIGGGLGSWLFWVQHNFERTFHAEDERWSFVDVAVQGSSYLKLPWPLRWFTADIGVHHVHHLNPRIPNYQLEKARFELEALAKVPALSWSDLRRSFTHVFWDAHTRRMAAPAKLSVGAASSIADV